MRGRRAPGRRGLGGAVQVEPAREPPAQPDCWVADVGSPGDGLAAARRVIDCPPRRSRPCFGSAGRRNRTIVSYIGGLISVRCLFCPGFIDNSHQCFMNGPSYRPNKSHLTCRLHGEDEHQLRYGRVRDLGNHLTKTLGGKCLSPAASAVYGIRRRVISRPSDSPSAEDGKWKM
jgi:hypothetical protein